MNAKQRQQFALLLLCLMMAACNLGTLIALITDPFRGIDICRRDFVQFYLAGRVIWDGKFPEMYSALPVLAQQYLSCATHIQTASPYPPPLLLLLAPLSIFTLVSASQAWLVMSLILYALSAIEIGAWISPRKKFPGIALTLALMLLSVPVQQDLMMGNVNSLVLFLLCSALRMRRIGHPVASRVLVGLSITLKLSGWAYAGICVLRRKWREFFEISGIAGVAIAATAIAFPGLFSLWLASLHGTGAMYTAASRNQSFFTIGQRLFIGMDEKNGSYLLPPLINFPSAAPVATCLCILVLSIFLFRAAWNIERPHSIAICFAGGSFLQPVAWEHYCVILWPLLAIWARGLLESNEANTKRKFIFLMALLVMYFWDRVPAFIDSHPALYSPLASVLLMSPAFVAMSLALGTSPVSLRENIDA